MKTKSILAAVAFAAMGLFSVPSLPAQEPPPFGVALPDPQIPGYRFPEPEAVVLGWINSSPENTAAISLHAWGLWTSLTTPSGYSAFGLPNAPVYLSWMTKAELQALSQSSAPALKAGAKRRLQLAPPTQLQKFGLVKPRGARPAAKTTAAVPPDTSVLETVAYDPSAAMWILGGRLFQLSTITAIYQAQQPQIPVFPSTAVALKPVYKAITPANLINGRYYVMSAWPGTPPVTPAIQQNGFPESDWSAGCIYVDIQNPGTTTSTGIDATCAGPAASPNAIYGLGDFLTIPITAGNLPQVESLSGDTTLAAGDFLILMAMHVTSRETTEWTWETFFWTPNPAAPPLPSSAGIAGARPAQLTSPAAHYAAVLAYQMVAPNQPINGGQSAGQPVVGYNPYLESGFNAATFGLSRPIATPNGPWVGTVGVQTNCMTCHALASVVFPGAAANAASYGTDFYIGRNDPYFSHTVQTDFLWSIADVVANQQQAAAQAKKK